jgi:hypothetical protein
MVLLVVLAAPHFRAQCTRMCSIFPNDFFSIRTMLSCPILLHSIASAKKALPGCDGWIHVVCNRVLICDEGCFKEASIVCPWCDPKLQEKRGGGIGASIISIINNLMQPTDQQQISPPTEQQQISPPIEEQQMFQSNEEQQMSPLNEQQ